VRYTKFVYENDVNIVMSLVLRTQSAIVVVDHVTQLAKC